MIGAIIISVVVAFLIGFEAGSRWAERQRDGTLAHRAREARRLWLANELILSDLEKSR